IAGLKKATAACCGGILSTGPECPAFAAKIPHARKKSFRVIRIHGNHRAAGGKIRTLQDFVPGLAAIGGLVKPAVLTVAPQLSRNASVYDIAVFGIEQNLGNALGIFQADVGPTVAAVGRFVDTVA